MIKVALPKGRIAQEALKIFEDFLQTSLDFEDRKLILKKKDFEFMLVRSQDVPVYVERGAADIGVVGLDVLEEKQSRLVRLLDLGFGKCTAAPGWLIDFFLVFFRPIFIILPKLGNTTHVFFAYLPHLTPAE